MSEQGRPYKTTPPGTKPRGVQPGETRRQPRPGKNKQPAAGWASEKSRGQYWHGITQTWNRLSL